MSQVQSKPVEKLSDADLQDLLQEIRGGSLADRRAALRAFDWTSGDLRKLGWSMAQKGVDLGTAMTVFLNGAPARYTHLRKDKVPPEARARCQVLDAIHHRAVSGFYLPDPELGIEDVFDAIAEWIARQEDDRAMGRVGRWVFDPVLFTPITLKAVQADHDEDDDPTVVQDDSVDRSIFSDGEKPRRVSLWRELLSPILG